MSFEGIVKHYISKFGQGRVYVSNVTIFGTSISVPLSMGGPFYELCGMATQCVTPLSVWVCPVSHTGSLTVILFPRSRWPSVTVIVFFVCGWYVNSCWGHFGSEWGLNMYL